MFFIEQQLSELQLSIFLVDLKPTLNLNEIFFLLHTNLKSKNRTSQKQSIIEIIAKNIVTSNHIVATFVMCLLWCSPLIFHMSQLML